MSSQWKLASAGDDIKIWDVNSFSLIKEYNPHDRNVCDICWSHDNNFLASVSNNDDKFGLLALKNNAFTIVDHKFMSGRNFVDYNSSSRYLLTGFNEAIHAWDLRTRSLRKTFKGHSGLVTCARFNWNDTYIASASDTGEIIVYNAVTGQGCSPMIAPKVQAIRQIQYSQFKKSLLGSVSDDGAFNLWDANTRRLVHSFTNAHHAPATGINFSPINELFLMSVGLDKRIVCYDLEAKKCLISMNAESPLTSIDMMSDGTTVAVGSTRGKIYIYDLRQKDTCIKVLNAHKSSVQSLKFQNSIQSVKDPSNKASSKAPTTMETSPTGRRQLPSAPIGQEEAPQYNNHCTTNDSIENEMFSPVGNGTHEVSAEKPVDSDVDHSQFSSYLQVGYSSGGVFSPLADTDSLRRSGGHGVSPMFPVAETERPTSTWDTPVSLNYSTYTTSKNGVGSSPSTASGFTGSTATNYSSPPLKLRHVSSQESYQASVGTSEESESLRRSPKERTSRTLVTNGGSPQSYFTSPRRQDHAYQPSPTERPAVLTTERERPTGISASASVTPASLDDSPSATAGADLISAPKTCTSPGGAHSLLNVNDSRHYGRHLDSSAAAPAQSQNFQTLLLRNIVHEALEDFRDQIHDEIQNLHLELIRQFQIQQNELTQLVRHYSVNQDLVQEVERLREENKMLKKNF